MDALHVVSFVKDQLSSDPSQSKKFLMALAGLGAIVMVVIAALVIFCINGSLAPQLVALITIVVPSIAGLVSVYLGAQGAVEVKANGVLQKSMTDKGN
jgi:hypothetical protein